jgi:hypothetical protein
VLAVTSFLALAWPNSPVERLEAKMDPLKLIGFAFGLTILAIIFSGFAPSSCSDTSSVFAGEQVSGCVMNPLK